MAFVSVPEERFAIDVHKSLITELSSSSDFTGVKILPQNPDNDIDLVTPCIVVHQVGNGEWGLGRMSGYYGMNDLSATELEELKGYLYQVSYQFDIFARNMTEQKTLQAKVERILRGGNGIGNMRMTRLPIKDFQTATDSSGTDTDLTMDFSFWKDVEVAEVKTFTPSLYQTNVVVSMTIDYITGYSIAKIQALTTTVEQEV